jgi:cyclic pyranopterin phosphate synthase
MSIMDESARDQALQDNFGRSFPYLRLSITDVCNFRCSYCLPDGYQKCGKHNFLRQDEIARLVDAFAALGVHKIRITGGEPTVRKDFTQIAQLISSHPAITQRAFTTNGYRLKENAKTWFDAGLNHINISVDSLNAERFYAITGHERLDEVRAGIDAAIEAGFKKVKINAVLLKGVNDHELADYLAWAKTSPISIRFIELMQTGDNLAYFKKYHQPAQTIAHQLLTAGWQKAPRAFDAGPAQVYTHPDYHGSIGLIAPYSKDFCAGCNRLRVTSSGDLRLCLFGSQGTSLRHLLQDDAQMPLLKQLIADQLAYKCSSHFLALGDTGITPHLASVGG